ncbi:MAG: hypothetical protein P1U74_09425 [Legionellaceae bacterium]|nr:hypothetical protein [Legionellaceae bacterium]
MVGAKSKSKTHRSTKNKLGSKSKIAHGSIRPENKAVSKCIELAQGNLTVLLHIQKEHDAIVGHFKCADESEVATSAIKDTISMAEYVHNERRGLEEKIRNGTITESELEMLKSDYFNFQDLLTQQKLKDIDKSDLAETFKDVVMVYDINDQSEFVRGYVSNGKQLNPAVEKDGKVIDLLDGAFHSWLVGNGLSSDAGVIYNKDKIDNDGHFTERANPEKVIECLNNPQKGLDATIKKQSPDLSLRAQRNQQSEPQQAPSADNR